VQVHLFSVGRSSILAVNSFLLFQGAVLRHSNAVNLISLRSFFLHDKELVDNLIHGLVVWFDLRRLIFFNDFSPVHVFELVSQVALSDDTLQDLNPVSQFSVLSRQVKILIFSFFYSLNCFIDVWSELTVCLHQLFGEINTFNHPITQRFGVESVEKWRALTFSCWNLWRFRLVCRHRRRGSHLAVMTLTCLPLRVRLR